MPVWNVNTRAAAVSFIAALLTILTLTTTPGELLDSRDIEGVVRKAAANQKINDEARFRYTYQDKEIIEELAEDGSVKHTESKTYVCIHTELQSYLKLVAINNVPYQNDYLQLQDEKIRQSIVLNDSRSNSEKERLREQVLRERLDETLFTSNLSEAFTFAYAGGETVNGYPTVMLDFSLKLGFSPRTREASCLTHLTGRIWIAADSLQLIRMTGSLKEDVDYAGGILGRLKKGSTITLEQADIGNGFWFPSFNVITYKSSVLLHSVSKRQTDQYSDYQLNPIYSSTSKVSVEKLP